MIQHGQLATRVAQRNHTTCTNFLLVNRSPSLKLARHFATLKPKKEFRSTYNAKTVEEGWYEWWQTQGLFKASSADYSQIKSERRSFTMITPPPNVTGSLHIGHALTFSIQDAIVRWKRMNGYDVQWIPGTDHAGIGTQSVVEKRLMKEKGLTRHDLGREQFVKEIWDWKENYGNRILHQMRKLGASLDWDQEFFTMDKSRSEAVKNAFIRLYEDGLIYRNTRLVNWCCALETVISDIEVDYKDITGRTFLNLPGRSKPVEFGVLHNFAYKVVNPDLKGIQELIVSTTRIETMLGDCAVAVHPNDKRYKSLHGKYVYHPILNKEIPIICDAQLVDMNFGTGVVKITPAHDPNDYACAKRHQLPIQNIFDKKGKLNKNCGVPELGYDRFEVRDIIINKLNEFGSYKGRNDKHVMRIATCSRSGDIIEPLLEPQWYIKCKELADLCKKQVELNEMKIIPDQSKQDWYRWLDNIQDWCVSRQLWWGHEIPAYQIKFNNEVKNQEELWVTGSDKIEAKIKAVNLLKQKGYPEATPFKLVKDQDVLDTWFSSGLLPLSALGWTGRKGEKIPNRYPLQIMETGFDILFFWVARMAMLSNHFTDHKIPFETVYLHAMVRDAQGRKMSKSLGNVIDPLHVIEGVTLQEMKNNVLHSNLPKKEIETSIRNLEKEYPNGIPACGTDSLRFSLIQYTQQSRQINLDINNVIQTSYFCNKLWNLFKFGLSRVEHVDYHTDNLVNNIDTNQLSLVDRFILSRMANTVSRCQQGFENSRLFEATDAIRRFIVEDVCDVYVEFSKATLNKSDLSRSEKKLTLDVLYMCMDVSLRLAHPFIPFVTEELWQHMNSALSIKNRSLPSLMVEKYPSYHTFIPFKDNQVEEHFKVILSIIHASRSLRQGHQISISKELPFIISCNDSILLDENGPLKLYMKEIQNFIKASNITIYDEKKVM
ncbi:valyl-tRNA synthetase [Cokeromyces recurvatus]|uniref:valyl-tRNA synthetase n=1 Tax=Cokeromyces recurvatus TaxID=90255 RepID=UPI00221F9DC1|nr:valyl-tRNA synthetase [Cokeromyces recurvatus]KAI7900845.1 valyl-tRNA synthetase [Cokeromyces recurvatus]